MSRLNIEKHPESYNNIIVIVCNSELKIMTLPKTSYRRCFLSNTSAWLIQCRHFINWMESDPEVILCYTKLYSQCYKNLYKVYALNHKFLYHAIRFVWSFNIQKNCLVIAIKKKDAQRKNLLSFKMKVHMFQGFSSFHPFFLKICGVTFFKAYFH